MLKIQNCYLCEEPFEVNSSFNGAKKFCSRKCANAYTNEKAKRVLKFQDEVLTPEYFEKYKELAEKSSEKNYKFWANWNIAYRDSGKQCRCCGHDIPKGKEFQKHYCDYHCYRTHKVNELVAVKWGEPCS